MFETETFLFKVVRQQRAYLEKVKCEHLKNWTCLRNPASPIPKSVLIEFTIQYISFVNVHVTL